MYRFNDAFRDYERRSWEEEDDPAQMERNETDWKLHRDNILKLIELYDKTDDNMIPVITEFYREGGMFEESIKIAEGFNSDSDFLNRVMKNIKDKAFAKDDKVFVLFTFLCFRVFTFAVKLLQTTSTSLAFYVVSLCKSR